VSIVEGIQHHLLFAAIYWWYIEGGGKLKYRAVEEFLFGDFHGRQVRVALYIPDCILYEFN
jgi:hypothetical protein